MIQNIRDIGGLRSIDGHIIRPGMLVRSAQLFQAEEQELQGIATVIDLRTPGERAEAPDQTYSCEYLLCPVFDDLTAGISHESDTEDLGIPDMCVLYSKIMKQCRASFRRILLTIMNHDYSKGAVLWHCSEGKDRCGITTALILEALDVDRKDIMTDYLKTNAVNLPKAVMIREKITAAHGQKFAEKVYQAYIADEKYLEAAWEAMGDDYIHNELQIVERTIQAFKRAVLKPV